ncbi:uncharacterized protein LOC110021679 [Phalaenopsis equestris]|uniref:uncharacterized protein LOC110021679 n=1 Tax=Phalaenopsis equestris TaxID=78828 RepID=UPI0009E228AA|nr:uncharacterized protein LOC110021679 [Phalaenopsis equestris]
MMPFKQQIGGGGGGGDQIKKLRKEKSMKEAEPDGFRKAPLQSSHLGLSPVQQKKPSPSKVTNGIKDKLQVSTDSLFSYRKIKSMNNLETSISSSNHTGSKTVDKELVRTSGLKPVRSSMKKNSGVGLHPTVNLSRATCSSTFKIARNPENLDLDESNSSSNVTLCSYKYCSLHGQKKHEMPLPALKCFLSARKSGYQ